MLSHVLGVLLAASLGGGGPHAVAPEDVCLLQERCRREAVYCLVGDVTCDSWRDGRICFVAACPER